MQIKAENISKKYHTDYIIRNFNYTFSHEKVVGIAGENGSGKSTLLQILSSVLTPTDGKMLYEISGKNIPVNEIRYSIALISPAEKLVQTSTVSEIIDFHFVFKNYLPGYDKNSLLNACWLTDSKSKTVAELSSGMKQRLKLALAFFSDLACILLDEPTNNLDQKGIEWVEDLQKKLRKNRLLIIASNEQRDFKLCDEIFHIENFK